MDIRPSRLAAAADTKTTTQAQQNPSDSSLLYRMAVRTMLEDLEIAKKKEELAAPATKPTLSGTTITPKPTIIPVPLPPAYLASSAKTALPLTPPVAPPIKTVTLPPSPTIKTEAIKPTLPTPPVPSIVSTVKTPFQEVKDDLTKIIEKFIASKKSEKTEDKVTIKKETEIKTKGEILKKTEEENKKEDKVLKIKEEKQKAKEEERKRKETEALKIKEEKQKAKEEQKAAQQLAREEDRKIREEEKIAKELAAKTARELKLAEETEKREAARKQQEELNKDLEQIQIDAEAGAHDAVLELAEKILANESISWFQKIKIGQHIKSANSGLRKKQIDQIKEATRIKDEENLKKIVASLPSSMPPINPQPITQKTTVSPPPNLPIIPESAEKIEDPVVQTLPQDSYREAPIVKEAPAPVPKPISPLLTELISEIPADSDVEESGPSFLQNKRVIFIGASVAVVILLVGFGIWFANKGTSPIVSSSPSKTPTISATPTPSRPAPEPLFTADKQKTITLSEGQNLKNSLLTLAKTEEATGTFTALNIKNSANKSLSLKEIAQSLNLEIFSLPTQGCDSATEDCTEPKTLETFLDLTNFSLIVYSQSGSSTNVSSPFATASRTNDGRLGLIIGLKKQTTSSSTQSIESQLVNSLKDLETFLPKELASFLLKTSVIPQIPTFSQASYKNAVIRYLNLPTSDIAIDYTIFDGKLILATSKDSMLGIIDQLAPASQAGERL